MLGNFYMYRTYSIDISLYFFLGKAIKSVEDLDKLSSFPPIPLLEPLIDIPSDVADKMSTDSRYAWKLLQAVTSGHLPAEVAAVKIGSMCHSRYSCF